MSSKRVSGRGIEGPNRALLTRLTKAFPGPFEVAEAAAELGLERDRTKRFLAYLTTRGWLIRVRRGLYTTQPSDANDPAAALADPWIVAAKTFAPCYIGGWTALLHWGITERAKRPVVVYTAAAIRNKTHVVQRTTFRLRKVDAERMFGTKTLWRERIAVEISDPERTLVDILDRPEMGGGIRAVADCLETWWNGPKRRPVKIIQYAEQLGNGAVFKRLGYLLEARGIDAPRLLTACEENLSTGVNDLDPRASGKAKVVSHWGLRVNARV